MFRHKFAALAMLLVFITAACNLASAPEEAISNTQVPSASPTGTIERSGGELTVTPTGLPPLSTQSLPPTSIVQLPPTLPGNPATPGLTSIFIISPVPGNVVAGNVQVLGSAVHPNFLQYQLEFGPEPNPGNLWYLIGGVRLVPVTNNLLGVWTTTDGRVPDGVYQLRLRVFLRDGTVAQTVVNNIRVQNQVPTLVPTATQSVPRPIAAFAASPTSGKAPLVVTFSNRSSGNITGYNWNFGDGSTSAEVNPVHTFRTAGSYEVKLTVSGPGGQSNVSTIIDVQTADPPVANFSADRTSGAAPLTVQFTDQSSGPIESYLWDFGDGVTTNERNPRHTFNEARLYNVILSVQGPGGTDRKRMTIVVQDQQIPAPVADFSPKSTSGNAPYTVQFDNNSSGQINSYEWDFGDGTSSSDANPVHVYQTPGTYTVTLTVFGGGGQDTESGTITVAQAPQAPDANFTADKTEGTFPLTVQFSSSSTGTITGYSWNFGDGTTSNEQNPRHTFQNPGTYSVRLTVFGAGNTSDFKDMVISVTEPLAPPNAEFTVNPASGSAPLTVTFTNQSSGDDITFAWNFGDGTSSLTGDAIFTHVYQNNGTYTVTLTVTNSEGDSDTATQTITVTDALNAAFTTTALSDPPQTFQFQSTSSGSKLTYRWDFGDGAVVEPGQAVVTHTYNNPGTYNVTLTIRDTNGAQDSVTQQVNVAAPTATHTWTPVPPTATFTVIPPTSTFTAIPATVMPQPVASFDVRTDDGRTFTFTDTSQPADTILTWSWDVFNDGTVDSVERTFNYTFNENGSFPVSLTVTNAAGQSTATQFINVSGVATATFTAEPPTATFTPEPPTLTPLPAQPVASFDVQTTDNRTFTFADTSQPADTILTWAWDVFNDGTVDSVERTFNYTFNENGSFPVSLTVTNAAGQSSATQFINVSGVPASLTADFTVESADGVTFNFTDISTPAEAVARREWDFNGDGQVDSLDQTATYTYTANGVYDVTLTVYDLNGQAVSDTQQVEVTALQPTTEAPDETESIVDTTPIQPNIDALASRLGNINIGERSTDVLTVIGDNSFKDGFLRPFGRGNYEIGGQFEYLVPHVDAYRAGGSLEADWLIDNDLNVAKLLEFPQDCNNETRIVCELNRSGASIAIFTVGLKDAQDSTDLELFRTSYAEVLQQTIDTGVIPVVLTIYPRPDFRDQILAINEVIIQVAEEKEIPVVNVWRMFNEIDANGGTSINPDNNAPTEAPNGPGVIRQDPIMLYGENARNYHILNVLSEIRRQVFGIGAGRR
jgi:PKD repeat protein